MKIFAIIIYELFASLGAGFFIIFLYGLIESPTEFTKFELYIPFILGIYVSFDIKRYIDKKNESEKKEVKNE